MKKQCPICGSSSVNTEIITETFEYKGKKLDIPNYIIHSCECCGEAVVDKETLKTSGKILRTFINTLQEAT